MIIVIDAAGGEALPIVTLASLPAPGAGDVKPLVVSHRATPTDPRCDVVTPEALRGALAARLAAARGAAVLFVHAGLTVLPQAAAELACALPRCKADALVPSVATSDGRRADALAASLPAAFLQGPAATGAIMLSADSAAQALALSFAADSGPFAGIADAALIAGAFAAPYPRTMAQAPRNFLRRIQPEMTQGRLELYAQAGPETAAALALLASLATGHGVRRNLVRKLGFRALRSPVGPVVPEIMYGARAIAAGLARLKARLKS